MGAGFGGFGRRDDMRVALTLKDVKKGVVVARATVEETSVTDETDRGTGGFGSTGI